MEEVLLIFSGLTNVWASEHTVQRILEELKDADTRKAFNQKLIAFAQAGFWNLNDNILRHEGKDGGGETWRIAYKNSSLFRVVGFHESDTKKDFIALDAFYKDSAEDYSNSQWKRMRQISEIKREGDKAWRKRPNK